MTQLIEAFALLVRLLEAAILVRVLYSWVDPSPYATNAFKRILWALTDPILDPLRRFVPPIGMFDVTPVVALILLQILERVVMSLQYRSF